MTDPFSLIDTSALLRLPDPVWLMHSVLPKGAVSVLYGQPESGKSFLALDWAMCISQGRPWLGKFATMQSPVIYIAAEGGTGIKKRVKAWMKHHEVAALPGMHWQVKPLLIRDEGVVQDAMDQLAAYGIELYGPDQAGLNPGLIVFDTLSRSFSNGDENSSDMTQFVDKVTELAAARNMAALIVHHMNATGSRERGHTSLRGNVNTMFKIVGSNNSDRKLVGAVLQNDKQKDDAKLADIHLETEIVDIGRGQNSVVFVEGAEPEKKVARAVPKAEMTRMGALKVLGASDEGFTQEEWRLALGGIAKSTMHRLVAYHLKEGNIEKGEFRKFIIPVAGTDIVDLDDE